MSKPTDKETQQREPFNPHQYQERTIPPGFFEALAAAEQADRMRAAAEAAAGQRVASEGTTSHGPPPGDPREHPERRRAEKATVPAVPALLRAPRYGEPSIFERFAGGAHWLARWGVKTVAVLLSIWTGMIALVFVWRWIEDPEPRQAVTPPASASTVRAPVRAAAQDREPLVPPAAKPEPQAVRPDRAAAEASRSPIPKGRGSREVNLVRAPRLPPPVPESRPSGPANPPEPASTPDDVQPSSAPMLNIPATF